MPAYPDRSCERRPSKRHGRDPRSFADAASCMCRGQKGSVGRRLQSGPVRVSVLAFAPFFLWPVLFLTFPVLVWLIDGAEVPEGHRERLRRAALDGWWFGFGFFRRPVLDRRSIPGRSGQVRLGLALCRDAHARGARPVLVAGDSDGAGVLATRRGAPRAACLDARRRANGYGAMCSPGFPGTRSATRSPTRFSSCRARDFSEFTGSPCGRS